MKNDIKSYSVKNLYVKFKYNFKATCAGEVKSKKGIEKLKAFHLKVTPLTRWYKVVHSIH